jgi:PIN domain nuclease of toxin-antitoxin system
MTEIVVDASIILAAVLQEPGHEVIFQLAKPPLISAVNLAEARSKMVDKGYPQEGIDESLAMFRLSVVAFDDKQAVVAAELRRTTRSHGLSLGDRACLALALSQDAVALTTDRAWQGIDLPVQVELVR